MNEHVAEPFQSILNNFTHSINEEIREDGNQEFLVSLVRGLQGLYISVRATSEDVVREFCSNYMGKIWCSVYDSDYFYRVVMTKFPESRIINPDNPIVLNDSSECE